MRISKFIKAVRLAAVGFPMLIVSTPVQAKRFCVGYFLAKPHKMPGHHEKPGGTAVEYFDRIAEKMGFSEVRFGLLLQRFY